ncbi:MAG TPA: hypothetical protein VMD59_15945 [Acidimicrobiales bacterium]|nr:hypothetical protein [Acidimicrobiales bacterium]
MTDEIGVVEHAELARPRRELGYCTDDAGRLLAVASRLAFDPDALRLATVALELLARGHRGDGAFRLRLGADRHWTDDPPSDDAAGRALLGLGTAVATAPWAAVQTVALELFDAAMGFRSAHPRALGYAVLGAAGVLQVIPEHVGARRLIEDARDLLPTPTKDLDWPWPAASLTYANALLPHASLIAAVLSGRGDDVTTALWLLEWLVCEETSEGHFSFAPVAGRRRGGPKPAFDQQPIEAWTMAEACACAYSCTGDPQWAATAARAAAWFLGENDLEVKMYDSISGGGYDGLGQEGVNRNQGAESSLAFVASMGLARAVQRQEPGAAPPCADRRARR